MRANNGRGGTISRPHANNQRGGTEDRPDRRGTDGRHARSRRVPGREGRREGTGLPEPAGERRRAHRDGLGRGHRGGNRLGSRRPGARRGGGMAAGLPGGGGTAVALAAGVPGDHGLGRVRRVRRHRGHPPRSSVARSSLTRSASTTGSTWSTGSAEASEAAPTCARTSCCGIGRWRPAAVPGNRPVHRIAPAATRWSATRVTTTRRATTSRRKRPREIPFPTPPASRHSLGLHRPTGLDFGRVDLHMLAATTPDMRRPPAGTANPDRGPDHRGR